MRLLPWDNFDNLAKLPSVHCPILVVHGKQDQVVSFWHGRRLYEAAGEPKRCLWVENCGHNDVWDSATPDYDRALADFVLLLDKRH